MTELHDFIQISLEEYEKDFPDWRDIKEEEWIPYE